MRLTLQNSLLALLLCSTLFTTSATIVNNLNWNTCGTNTTQSHFFQIQDLEFFNTESQTVAKNLTTGAFFVMKEQFMFNCVSTQVLLNTPDAFCMLLDSRNNNYTLIKFTCSNNDCQIIQSQNIRDTASIADLEFEHIALVVGATSPYHRDQSLMIVSTYDLKIISDSGDTTTIFYGGPYFLHDTTMVYFNRVGGPISHNFQLGKIDWATQKLEPIGPEYQLNTGFLVLNVLSKTTLIVEDYQNYTIQAYDLKGNLLKSISHGDILPYFVQYNSSHLLSTAASYMELMTFNTQSLEFEFSAKTPYPSNYQSDFLFARILPNGNVAMIAIYENLEYALDGNSFKVKNFQYCLTSFKNERYFVAENNANIPIQIENKYVILGQNGAFYNFDENMKIISNEYLKKTYAQFNRAYLDLQSKELFSIYEKFPASSAYVYEFSYQTKSMQTNFYINMPTFWDNSRGRIFSILQNSDTNRPAFLYHLDIQEENSKPVYAVFGNVATQIYDSIYIDNLFANYDPDTQVVTLYYIIGNSYGTVGKVEFDMKTKSTINEKELAKHGSIAKVDNNSVLIADFDNNKVWLEKTQRNETAWSVDIPSLSNGGYLGYLGHDGDSDDVIKGFVIVDKKGTRAISYDLKSKTSTDLNIEKNDLDISYRLYQSGPNQVFISVSRMDMIFDQYGYSYQEESSGFQETRLFLEKFDY